MRTLQYNMRTQVTKEAIARMAESAGKLHQHKRRKIPKQLNRLLGEADTRWAGEVNLAVSAESLRISSASNDREIMNHSLPSISFASGGDGPTLDFIGYVAKDPVHERACHVFECVQCSQYVLTTIGQAFELRYKMYLNSPHPEPLQIRNTIRTGDSWSQSAHVTHEDKGASPQGEPPFSPTPGAGIYSDLPEFPADPVPSPSSKESHGLPSLTTVSGPRSRIYSQLPGFPTVAEDEEPLSNGTGHARLDNPYDTIHMSRAHRDTPLFPPSGVYSEPGEITSSCEEANYSARMMTIKQSPMTSANSELIDLTPPLDQPNHVYSNTGASIHNGTASAGPTKTSPPPKPRPLPRPMPRPAKKRLPSSSSSESAEVIYDDPTGSLSAVKPPGREAANLHGNDYDDPDALHTSPLTSPPLPTSLHTSSPPIPRSPRRPADESVYDDIQEVIAARPKKRSSPPPLVPKARKSPPPPAPNGGQGSGGPKPVPRGPPRSRGVPPPNLPPPPIYDDPSTVIHSNGFAGRGRNEEGAQGKASRTRTPKFDDTIYAIRPDVGFGGGAAAEEEEERNGAAGNTGEWPSEHLVLHEFTKRGAAESCLHL
ncbi:SHC-transforming protein 4 [Geodia barretti]|nr:SHC-transforming protein 4 [Geodia barretti]